VLPTTTATPATLLQAASARPSKHVPITICAYVPAATRAGGLSHPPRTGTIGSSTLHAQQGSLRSAMGGSSQPLATVTRLAAGAPVGTRYHPDESLAALQQDKSLRAALNLFRPHVDARSRDSPAALPMHVRDGLDTRQPLSRYKQAVEERLPQTLSQRPRAGSPSPHPHAQHPHNAGYHMDTPHGDVAVPDGTNHAAVIASAASGATTLAAAHPTPEMRRLAAQAEVLDSSRFLRPASHHRRLHGVSPASDSFRR